MELGRLAEAAALVDPMAVGEPSLDNWAVHEQRVRIDVSRGDLEGARQRLAAVRAIAPSHLESQMELAQTDAELDLWGREPRGAANTVMDLLGLVAPTPLSRDADRLLILGMRAQADLAERARARGQPEELERALAGGERLMSLAESMQREPFTAGPLAATADAERSFWEAELARLQGRESSDLWEAAADQWKILRRPRHRAYALWRQADCLLATGQRAIAEPVIREAAEVAVASAPLTERIGALASRARVDLGVTASRTRSEPEDPNALTDRERQVLRLLAQGRTNGQIGAALFMSPKTASVHVTHILRKLGVSGRVQAATFAERSGLLDHHDPGSD